MNSFHKWTLFFIGLLIITIVIIRPYYQFVTKTLKVSPIQALLSLDGLKSFDNQVNFVLLGIAGGDHDGPNLSDSITVVSYNLKTNKLSTISLPRDIWSDTLDDKINSAYAYGEAKKPEIGGLILAKAEISSVIGLPVQYAAVIDFDHFKELVNFFGGIEVNVERSFTDKKYPIPGRENDECDGDKTYKCRYETIAFNKGETTMDGDAALKFVRSRYSESEEGTDFAREQRQQKVIEAVKNKLISLVKTPNLKKYGELYGILDQIIKRDISNQQVAIIIKKILFNKKLAQQKITLTEDLFTNPVISDKYNGAWVLIPKDNNFSIIHQYIKCYLENRADCQKLKNKS